MHVRHLSLTDFRSYPRAELALDEGVSILVGLNGQGKTNLVEAIGCLATLGSHRVATDGPLVRAGAERAVIRAAVVRDGREVLVELEINLGRPNRARLGKAALARTRDVLGALRTVLFAPEDLALVKGDPAERRRFLDDLLVARQPRWAAVRSDVDRLLRQRNALLRSAAPQLRRAHPRPVRVRSSPESDPSSVPPQAEASRMPRGPNEAEVRENAVRTLEVWNAQLAQAAAPLLYARLRLLRDLAPLLSAAYAQVSAGSSDARMSYRSSLRDPVAERIAAGEVPEIAELHDSLLDTWDEARENEVERGLTLAGPHRDDLVLGLGDLPAKGYASHGEAWSFALGLKLAAYQLLRNDLRDDPVLILDDVFAELDTGRRDRLAAMVADCEQVLVTAAVPADVPASLRGRTYAVTLGAVSPCADAGAGRPGAGAAQGGSRSDAEDADHVDREDRTDREDRADVERESAIPSGKGTSHG